MILRVACRIQLEPRIRVNRIGPQTDPNTKLIGDLRAYSEAELKSMEISWRIASFRTQLPKNKPLMLPTEGCCGGYSPAPGSAAAGILTEARWVRSGPGWGHSVPVRRSDEWLITSVTRPTGGDIDHRSR